MRQRSKPEETGHSQSMSAVPEHCHIGTTPSPSPSISGSAVLLNFLDSHCIFMLVCSSLTPPEHKLYESLKTVCFRLLDPRL